MKFNIINAIRTNNFNDPDIQNKLISSWNDNQNLVKEAFTMGKTVFGVYHEYESNYKGDYSFSIGIEDFLKGKYDCSSYAWKKYEIDTSDKLGILNTWKIIWDAEEKGNLTRIYDFDLEVYDPNGKIYILVAYR
ncbi:transcriptional regulator, partial [Lactococcus petauri]|jgi:predicted transcriptional regulator YdeE|uniref:transcriptional regulator n=1 Tax=Lactococcus petauri TaxID=1940789 RepID=UPI0025514050